MFQINVSLKNKKENVHTKFANNIFLWNFVVLSLCLDLFQLICVQYTVKVEVRFHVWIFNYNYIFFQSVCYYPLNYFDIAFEKSISHSFVRKGSNSFLWTFFYPYTNAALIKFNLYNEFLSQSIKSCNSALLFKQFYLYIDTFISFCGFLAQVYIGDRLVTTSKITSL